MDGENLSQQSVDYRRAEAASRFLEASFHRQPSLEEIARGVHRSTLIPCHRVITGSGKTHRYHWGTARKKAMLSWEAAHARR